jgi:hypothetical protein
MQTWLYEETLFHWCDKCYIDDESDDDDDDDDDEMTMLI